MIFTHLNLLSSILIIKTNKINKMHCFSTLFGKELYIFQTDLLSVIRSLNTVFTVICICHNSYVDCCYVICLSN